MGADGGLACPEQARTVCGNGHLTEIKVRPQECAPFDTRAKVALPVNEDQHEPSADASKCMDPMQESPVLWGKRIIRPRYTYV